VLADGRVAAWGADDHGQLGNGSREGSPTPVFVRAPDGQHGDLRGAVAVRADTDFSMALLRDGTVLTWGRGNRAQRGNGGTSAAPLTPTRVVDTTGAGPLRNVVQIAADGNTELALLRDGTVVGWGNNDFGQLGPGATKRVPVPVRVQAGDGQPLRGITGIAVGGQHSLALRSDGHVLSWGRNDMYQLGDGSRTDRAVPGPVRGSNGRGDLTGVAVIAAAEKHSAALLRDGTVVTWGNNTAGQLGAGTRGLRTWPVTVVAEDGKGTLGSVTSVSVGEAYSVAVRRDGDVLTWGSNSHGQLGSADPAGRSRPGPVDTQAGVPLPLHIVAVGTGQRHLLLLTR
jgi:alpha-tubulin suppressor-like RCC1 family protein